MSTRDIPVPDLRGEVMEPISRYDTRVDSVGLIVYRNARSQTLSTLDMRPCILVSEQLGERKNVYIQVGWLHDDGHMDTRHSMKMFANGSTTQWGSERVAQSTDVRDIVRELMYMYVSDPLV